MTSVSVSRRPVVHRHLGCASGSGNQQDSGDRSAQLRTGAPESAILDLMIRDGPRQEGCSYDRPRPSSILYGRYGRISGWSDRSLLSPAVRERRHVDVRYEMSKFPIVVWYEEWNHTQIFVLRTLHRI